MSLRQVNLNLLPIFQALLTHGSVTRAAQTLGLSQSAVSDALARLRATFGDPLLIRVGGRMALTPRALELQPLVHQLCTDLEAAFARPGFDPKTSSRRFVIATADYGAFLVAKDWLARLAEQASSVRLRFVAIDHALPSRLADQAVDFAIMPAPFLADLAPAPLSHQTLTTDRPVALFRVGHALDRGGALGEAELADQRVLLAHPGVDSAERRNRDMFSGGIPFDAVLSVPQITLLPYLLLDSDQVAIVPDQLAHRMCAILPLAMAPLKFVTGSVTLHLVWSRVQDADPGHRWFRSHVAQSKI